MARFPSPYLNSTNANDPLMERVPVDQMGIGANSAGLPKGGINSGNMTIKHIGGGTGKSE